MLAMFMVSVTALSTLKFCNDVKSWAAEPPALAHSVVLAERVSTEIMLPTSVVKSDEGAGAAAQLFGNVA